MIELISDPQYITPDWLTTVLKQSGSLPTGRVTSIEWQLIGTGKMGDNVRFEITYDGNYSAPTTLIAKFPAQDQTARATAAAMGVYRQEVMFYRHQAALTSILTPKIYLALIDHNGADFILLMQDLAPAQPGDQLIGETTARTRKAMAEAARVHADFYDNKERLAKDYISRTNAQSAAYGQSLMQQHWPDFLTRFGHGLTQECIAFGDKYVQHHAQWVSRYDGIKTLIHGDFRTENLLFNQHGRAIVIDWQTQTESCALADIAYFIGGSMTTGQRRQHEKALVEYYRQCLSEAGVNLSWDDCWQQYREFSPQGLMTTVLGAMFTAPETRSDQMYLVMAQRHLQHCVDMQAEDFLTD